jgi:hypothetical protein
LTTQNGVTPWVTIASGSDYFTLMIIFFPFPEHFQPYWITSSTFSPIFKITKFDLWTSIAVILFSTSYLCNILFHLSSQNSWNECPSIRLPILQTKVFYSDFCIFAHR